MTDTYATIKVLATTRVRSVVKLVVNQTRRDGEGRNVSLQLQRVVDRFFNLGLTTPVHLELQGHVPLDIAVRESVLRRQLLVDSLPGSQAALAVAAVGTPGSAG